MSHWASITGHYRPASRTLFSVLLEDAPKDFVGGLGLSG